jgi:hypothetical protein
MSFISSEISDSSIASMIKLGVIVTLQVSCKCLFNADNTSFPGTSSNLPLRFVHVLSNAASS